MKCWGFYYFHTGQIICWLITFDNLWCRQIQNCLPMWQPQSKLGTPELTEILPRAEFSPLSGVRLFCCLLFQPDEANICGRHRSVDTHKLVWSYPPQHEMGKWAAVELKHYCRVRLVWYCWQWTYFEERLCKGKQAGCWKEVFFWCLIRWKKPFTRITFVMLPGSERPVVTQCKCWWDQL